MKILNIKKLFPFLLAGILIVGLGVFENTVVYAEDGDEEVTGEILSENELDGNETEQKEADKIVEINKIESNDIKPADIEGEQKTEGVEKQEVALNDVVYRLRFAAPFEGFPVFLDVNENSKIGDELPKFPVGDVQYDGWTFSDGVEITEDTVITSDIYNKYQKSGVVIISPRKHTEARCKNYEVTDFAKAATCTEDGLTEGAHCRFCNRVITAQTVIPKLGHDWKTDWDSDGNTHYHTCQNCGEKKDEAPHTPGTIRDDNSQICTVCGHELIGKHDHNEQTIEEVAASVATCTAPALRQHYECKLCKKYFDDQNGQNEIALADITTAPALGHKFGEWTDIGNGKQERICSVCNGKEERNKPVVPGNGNQSQGNSGSSSNKSSGHSSGSMGTPAPVVNTVSPQTADTSNTFMWAALMLLSAAGAVFCIAKKNKAA